jgi:hypothetical protein
MGVSTSLDTNGILKPYFFSSFAKVFAVALP